jgi:hypothetical protein
MGQNGIRLRENLNPARNVSDFTIVVNGINQTIGTGQENLDDSTS